MSHQFLLKPIDEISTWDVERVLHQRINGHRNFTEATLKALFANLKYKLEIADPTQRVVVYLKE